MGEIFQNKAFLAAAAAVLVFGGAVYFVFQEFNQLENQLASLQEQISSLEESTAPVTVDVAAESEPEATESEPEPESGSEPEEETNACDYLNCDTNNGWIDSGSAYSCQDGAKTCTCQKQVYRNYSCSSLKQECVYSITNTKTNKYSCVEPEPEPEYPDLIVQSPDFFPAAPAAGDDMTFWATIKNRGEASVASSLSYVSIDGQKIAEFSTVSLTANESIVVTGATTWLATAGDHEFEFCADGDSAVEESNELNNCTETTFTVAAAVSISQPDLVIQSLGISPASTTAGETVSFSGIVKNQGEAWAASSLTLLYLDDEPQGTMSTNDLGIDATRTETWFWTATAGNHQFKICADVDSNVAESNETNNCSYETFIVAP